MVSFPVTLARLRQLGDAPRALALVLARVPEAARAREEHVLRELRENSLADAHTDRDQRDSEIS